MLDAPPASGLTPEERRLIDEALAAGRVFKAPPGLSSEPVYRAHPETGKPVAVDPVDGTLIGPAHKYKPKHDGWTDEIVGRREAVKRMAESGLSADYIAGELGVPGRLVETDLYVLGVSPNGKSRLPAGDGQTPEERAPEIRRLARLDMTIPEIAEELGLDPTTVNRTGKANGIIFKRAKSAPRGISDKRQARLDRVASLCDQGASIGEMSAELGVARNTIAQDLNFLGLKAVKRPGVRGRNTGERKADVKRAEAREKKRSVVVANAQEARDRRRFKSSPVPTGAPAVVTEAERSIFPGTVTAEGTALKDGAHNSKIGGDVLVGFLKGVRILTLTLEERATCPRSCAQWKSCYGNAMPQAHRQRHGPELEARLAAELEEHLAAAPAVLVRLHVLGDFYSTEYVRFWWDQLQKHTGLHCFGFTAWAPDTPIGGEVARTRWFFPSRFMIRHSGLSGPMGAVVLSGTPDPDEIPPTVGDIVVCPEQRDALQEEPRGKHCGSCAVCWETERPILFVQH